MKYSKILLCMTALFCLAFQAFAQDPLGAGSSGSSMGSSGDWISPNMGQVADHDRSMMDPGIAGMLRWLDAPVSNFPWYSADLTFYKQAVPDTTFSPYQEYYARTGAPVEGGIISNPTKFNVTEKMPSSVFYGAGVGLPYSQYAAVVPSKTNDLWIQGATNWTQYVVSPVGNWLQLVAYAPVEGPAGFYEMTQTDTTGSKYKTYQFSQGYNTMSFKAEEVGRHMLYFVVNSQPSNVVVVDVFAQTPAENAAVSNDPAANQTSETASTPKPAETSLLTTPSMAAFLNDGWTPSTPIETFPQTPFKQRQMN